jgi:hypothetical protein
MSRRPPLTDKSFLGFLFSPKKNPLPSGLRKTTLTGLKGGRNKRRLTAFNRMNPVSQEALKRAGLRDAYLRGEATLADAKKALRPRAVAFQVARPVKARGVVPGTRTSLDRMIEARFKDKVRDAGRRVNQQTVKAQIGYLSPERDMLTWDYGRFKYAGRKGSEYEVVDEEGITHNPFWYH